MKAAIFTFFVLFGFCLSASPRIEPVIGSLAKGPTQSKDGVTVTYLIQNDEIFVEEVSATALGPEWSKPPFASKLQNLYNTVDNKTNSLRFVLDLTKPQQKLIFFRAKNKIAPYQEFIESFYSLYIFFLNSKAYAKNPLDRFPGKVGPLIK